MRKRQILFVAVVSKFVAIICGLVFSVMMTVDKAATEKISQQNRQNRMATALLRADLESDECLPEGKKMRDFWYYAFYAYEYLLRPDFAAYGEVNGVSAEMLACLNGKDTAYEIKGGELLILAMPKCEDFPFSFYGPKGRHGPQFHGRILRDGSRFDASEISLAHATLSMGALALVDTPKGVIAAEVIDRGPFMRVIEEKWGAKDPVLRVFDGSQGFAKEAGYEQAGIATYNVCVVKLPGAFMDISRAREALLGIDKRFPRNKKFPGAAVVIASN